MDAVCLLVKNSVSHAFNALCENKNGCVPKSRLLVLAASLGNHLNQQNVEKGLPEHRSTQYLKFPEFMFYLEKELFTSLPKDLSIHELQKLHYDVDDVCWLVCKHEFYSSEKNECPEAYYFYLFRIFCSLADIDDSSEGISSAVLNACQLRYIVELYDKLFGNDLQHSYHQEAPCDLKDCTFDAFITFMNKSYLQSCDKYVVIEATNEVYDTIVENVIKKGFLRKLLTSVGPWWEMWFVLKQHTLTWSFEKCSANQWGEIDFQNSKIQIDHGSGTQFSLVVDSKAMVLNAADCATKSQWIAALNVVLKHCKMLEPYQQICAAKRRQAREESALKLEEEKQNLLSKEQALDQERKNKEQLELVLQKESEKIKDMEMREKILITQLEEEKQAKRDEEIVRNLQSRLLAEEWERREVLEKLQQQKDILLSEEREKREELEVCQKERLEEISQLENVVACLEKEKEVLNGTLKRTKNIIAGTGTLRSVNSKKHHNLKRSLSADLSHIQTGHWSLHAEDGEHC